MKLNIEKWNAELANKTALEIINWALIFAKRPFVTTNFGPRSASLLHAVNSVNKNVDVVWIDTGYNTMQTYKFANNLIAQLGLNIHIYEPRQTVAHRYVMIGIPEVGTEEHKEFTDQVKLEPFKIALKTHNPDVWFANIRKGQTAFRDTLDILSFSTNGLLKVAPFYHYSDSEVEDYLKMNDLPDQPKYFDPTKVLNNRECGLHMI